jgi:hypothetical protein
MLYNLASVVRTVSREHGQGQDRLCAGYDALEFTKNYTASGSYHTGRQFVNYLISAARLAEKSGNVGVAEQLEDFSEYAAGEIPFQLLETFYHEDRDNEASNELLRTLMQFGLARAAQSLNILIEEKSDASQDST